MSQRNSLYSYLKQTKISFFFLLQDQRTGGQNRRGSGGVGTIGRGEDVGKGHRTVNMVQIPCAHVCKRKNETC
jgi:hypothetical protein